MFASKRKSSICFIAGRSGGHILPALTLASKIKSENPQSDIIFFSTYTDVDKNLMHNQSIVQRWIFISLGNFPRKKIHKYPLFIWQLFIAFVKSFFYLLIKRPQKIIAMGGYISIPLCIAAWLARIPQELFELNVLPGKATAFLAPLVPKIAICFKQAKNYLPAQKCHFTDYPIRFSPHVKTIPRKTALATMTFLTARSTIMILGGSQGSAFLNNIIKQWIISFPAYHSKIQIIHQTGLLHDKYNLEDFYDSYQIPAYVFNYSEELEHCYQASDVIISRAGAGTLFEITFFNKPCITIPLQAATTAHQYYNAQAMKTAHPSSFIIIEQQALTNNIVLLNKALRHYLQNL